jgi:hypothetical protein
MTSALRACLKASIAKRTIAAKETILVRRPARRRSFKSLAERNAFRLYGGGDFERVSSKASRGQGIAEGLGGAMTRTLKSTARRRANSLT